LFDLDAKKPIPEMPMHIGIVTSAQGAALQDMISVAKRRFPLVELIVAPCQVQGADAPRTIITAIKELNQVVDNKPLCDVILVGRGGGSIEDLWAFNDEGVARAIFHSGIPIVTGVGHQTDFTIADFVADLRAPTPTAAMELLTPDGEAMLESLESFKESRMEKILDDLAAMRETLIDSVNDIWQSAQRICNFNGQTLDHTMYKLQEKTKKFLQMQQNSLEILRHRITGASPEGILKKGFVLVEQAGKFVKRSADLSSAEPFALKFFDGKRRAVTSEEEG
jgi:exodeoxyribonuclease VII large subunit